MVQAPVAGCGRKYKGVEEAKAVKVKR